MSSGSRFLTVFFAVFMALPGNIFGHEAWLEPFEFRIELGEIVEIDWRVGTDFKGNKQPNIGNWYESFQIRDADGSRDVDGDQGQRPAGKITGEIAGLNVISYFSTPSVLTFRDWQKFESYAENEGFDGLVEQHKLRGLPETGFREAFTRCSKTLVQVGAKSFDGEPGPLGLPYELVLLAGLDSDGDVEVELLWQGKPAANAQIRIFEKTGKDTDMSGDSRVVRTDALGRISVTLEKGRRFMMSAVRIDRVERDDLVYESFWANLTFER